MQTLSGDDFLRCVVMRGGTSRGVFFHERDLPRDQGHRDRTILAALGAPDPRQVDGLGGGDLLLSKAAIVKPSASSDADVECTFANVAPGKDLPTYGTNCGNLVSAVAVFAIDEGLVDPQRGGSLVRIHNRNSGIFIDANVQPVTEEMRNPCELAGMPTTGFCVEMDFIDPVGTTQSRLLPTGGSRDTIRLKNGRLVDATIVDAGALYVFVRAEDVGLSGTETSAEIQSRPGVLEDLEYVRGAAAKLLGLVDAPEEAIRLTPDVPKLAFVGPPTDYRLGGSPAIVDAGSIDLVSRIVSSQQYHRAYAVTAAIATAAAAMVQGSTVQVATGMEAGSGMRRVRIGHPSGVIECGVECSSGEKMPVILRSRITRTARRIMEGRIFVPNGGSE